MYNYTYNYVLSPSFFHFLVLCTIVFYMYIYMYMYMQKEDNYIYMYMNVCTSQHEMYMYMYINNYFIHVHAYKMHLFNLLNHDTSLFNQLYLWGAETLQFQHTFPLLPWPLCTPHGNTDRHEMLGSRGHGERGRRVLP